MYYNNPLEDRELLDYELRFQRYVTRLRGMLDTRESRMSQAETIDFMVQIGLIVGRLQILDRTLRYYDDDPRMSDYRTQAISEVRQGLREVKEELISQLEAACPMETVFRRNPSVDRRLRSLERQIVGPESLANYQNTRMAYLGGNYGLHGYYYPRCPETGCDHQSK